MNDYASNPMFYDLTAAEMLTMVKSQTQLSPVRRDCVVERDDGVDLDAWLREEIELWYSRLLLEADPSLLPVEDVRAETMLTADSEGVVTARLPERVVRPVEIRLAAWQKSVTHFLKPDDPECRTQFNRYTRGRTANPAAIDYGDRVLLFSAGGNALGTLTAARCVVRPDDGHFVFHRSVMPEIEFP